MEISDFNIADGQGLRWKALGMHDEHENEAHFECMIGTMVFLLSRDRLHGW